MRITILAACALAAACAAGPGGSVTTASLAAADAATALIAGQSIEASWRATPAAEGADPVVALTLRHADGRTLAFQQANHAANDLAAQAPGGPLAQIMGLFGEEAPALYTRVAETNGAPFLCGPEGPAALGLHDNPDGTTQIVGLKQPIQFETRPDGGVEALPYSPDMVCARLRFRR